MTLVTRFDGVEQRIACGRGAWQKGRAAWGLLPGNRWRPAAHGPTDNTFTAKLCFYETPFIVTIRLKFSGKELHYTSESNVGFGPTKESELVGKAE